VKLALFISTFSCTWCAGQAICPVPGPKALLAIEMCWADFCRYVREVQRLFAKRQAAARALSLNSTTGEHQ
jgi:hypothetical protein